MTPSRRLLVLAVGLGLACPMLVLIPPALAPRVAGADGPAGKKPHAPPPLEADDEPLLLEETHAEAVAKAGQKVARNDSCFVCHVNYKSESLATNHAAHGVGCVSCHGLSEAHRNDENNITPPDVMFPLATLDAACQKCHASHNVPARKVIARFQERCAGLSDPGRPVCTDCHGEHRLAQRTVRWDRQTRLLQPAARK
jgi:hypothetical protein